MSISSFERFPLLFGPSPVHRLERLTAHLGGADLGQAGGLQLGHRLRRQQDAQAGVPGRRRARAGLRHAGLDRRRPVQPHPSGRRGRRARRPQVRADPGELGRLAGRRLRQGGQHPAQPAGGGRRAADQPGFGIGFKESWEQALARSRRRRQPYPIPAGASDHPLGGLGFANWAYEVAAQEQQLGVFFDTIVVCSVTGSTQAGMIAGFAALADAGGAPTDPRHRRLGQARANPGPGHPYRPGDGDCDRAGPRPARRRDRARRALPRRGVRHPRRRHPRRHAAGRPNRRA